MDYIIFRHKSYVLTIILLFFNLLNMNNYFTVIGLAFLSINLMACKPMRNLFGPELKSVNKCVFDQNINSLEIQVVTTKNDDNSQNRIYDFKFSENFFVPFFNKNESTQPLETDFNGSSIIGGVINYGTGTVRELFKYLKGSFKSTCQSQSYWNNKPDWPGHPTIKIQINHRDIFEAQFQPNIEDINCPKQGLIAKKVTIEANESAFTNNQMYKFAQTACSNT